MIKRLKCVNVTLFTYKNKIFILIKINPMGYAIKMTRQQLKKPFYCSIVLTVCTVGYSSFRV